MDSYNFAFITDKKYLKITLVAILNLLKTKNKEAFYKLYLIYTEKEEIDGLPDFKKFGIDNYDINVIYFDSKLVSNFKEVRHVSKATYVKFFIPDLINESNILFLDGDIYINRNLESIWDEFSDEYSIMAVSDPGYKDENEFLRIDDKQETFNAGVLLLNLDKMRRINLCKTLVEYTNLNGDKIKNADQSVFNAVCKNDWKKIPESYNLQRIHFINLTQFFKIDKKKFKEYISNPYIIHFTTHSKPWMFRSAHPYKRKYLKNYKDLFKFNYDDITFMNVLKKIYEGFQYFKSNITICGKRSR